MSEIHKRVLVVDDEPHVRETLCGMLECAGFDVASATDGMDAFRRLKQTPVDLVVTDILMPEKEGIETIRELRRDYPCVRILAISGGNLGGQMPILEFAAKLGAHRVLAKPFRAKRFLREIHELLELDAAAA